MSQTGYRMSEPELRSVELLQGVVKSTAATLVLLTQTEIKVRVRGESKRWYEIYAKYHGHDDIFDHGGNGWNCSVNAGRRESDIVESNDYCAQLCLHANEQGLPIGDQVVSLILSLSNDIQTAMEIPLLAQFIVCKRPMLANIMIFQDTMIVTEEMAEFDPDWMDEQQEEELHHHITESQDEQWMEERYSLEDFLEEQRENDEELEAQRVALEEKKRSRDEQLTEFWNHLTDKFHDSNS
ncbi:MAG: hypothetical protein HN458_04045 [Euryarchaeota archaeon]|nr:hypothetical protein [Euryarchaeota archaeon]